MILANKAVADQGTVSFEQRLSTVRCERRELPALLQKETHKSVASSAGNLARALSRFFSFHTSFGKLAHPDRQADRCDES